MTEPLPRTPRRAPLYGDRSPEARLYWLRKTLDVYEQQAAGHHSAASISEYASKRLPGVRAEIERLERELSPLRIVK